jgi:integrase
MTGRTAEVLLEGLDVAARGHRPGVLDLLWEAMPPGMQLTYLSAQTVPVEYRGAFIQRPGHVAGIDLAELPEPMRRELAWCLFRIAEQGGKIAVRHVRMLAHRLHEVIGGFDSGAPSSLMDLSAREWHQHMVLAVQRRTGALPPASMAKQLRNQLTRCYRLLAAAYDTRPWWQREIWDPVNEPRIPQRAHEPLGRQVVYFHRIGIPWLRRGLQWHCKVGLETGQLAWTTVHHRLDATSIFDAFLADAAVPGPWLADDPADVRVLMLDFLGHLRGRPVRHTGPTHGQPLSEVRVNMLLNGVEQLYVFMHDHREAAAAALGEPGWLRLGPQHAPFYRRGEKPRPPRRTHERDVIDDDALTRIMAGTGILGDPIAEGGLGDEQAMRVLMLLARTGRRINEILMLDHDPLLPLDPLHRGTAPDPDGFVARLRYQQTKIAGAPDTILVDQEVVTIIRAQQQWAAEHMASSGSASTPKYLFLGLLMNRHGQRPYPLGRLHDQLAALARRLDIRDGAGRLVDFQRTHRFRHTKATSLLNAGVPLHVVQRYLGHLSPTMTMTYAQTLAATHEREFLRFRKVTADARDLEIDPRDLYDMLELDRRTDRILPNGWCLLPPRQSCAKGNACLTCDKFATDATFLPELQAQLARTGQLIDERRAAFQARTGQQLGEDNVWLAGRRQEQDALGRIIVKLEQTRLADGTIRAVRGAGVTARTDAITNDRDES